MNVKTVLAIVFLSLLIMLTPEPVHVLEPNPGSRPGQVVVFIAALRSEANNPLQFRVRSLTVSATASRRWSIWKEPMQSQWELAALLYVDRRPSFYRRVGVEGAVGRTNGLCDFQRRTELARLCKEKELMPFVVTENLLSGDWQAPLRFSLSRSAQ